MTTEFQKKVYALTKKIPKGKVATYGFLSQQLHVNCPQAIGQALRNNPFAPHVPCHRVVPKSLAVGGFFGSYAMEMQSKKHALLVREGITFDQKGRIQPHHVWQG